MKLREIAVKNFRCLVDVRFPVGDKCVLIGENNSGKTALLDALRIALTRATGGRSLPFDEYDYHMSKSGDSPDSGEGITIELWFREDNSGEWPDSLIQPLQEVIQTDPASDIDSVGLRLSCKADPNTKALAARTEFLTLDGQPLGGKASDIRNVTRFTAYVRLLALSAHRDSSEEFSPRSQYWGRILKDLKISEEQKKKLTEDLASLNDALLRADPRLEEVRESLAKVQGIMSLGGGQKTAIQAMPLKPWDLMSKCEVVIKPRGSEVDIPLSRHGQGMQSLAVIFLFGAFVDVLLKPSFEPETEAILTLEEPEAHLHPQATRAMAAHLDEVNTQKLISSHSPYFIQEIPFSDIRLFRRNGASTEVLYIKRAFTAKIPSKQGIVEYRQRHAPKYSFQTSTGVLTVSGTMEKAEYRDLLSLYPNEPPVHQVVKGLREESTLYLSGRDLTDLDTYAKRIRGEILFARAWLLWEGQSEYPLMRYFGELLGAPFDFAGISLIDYRNNGSAGAFVRLARALQFPWLMICDNDDQGRNSVREAKTCGLTDAEVGKHARVLPGVGTDLESFLFTNGFADEFRCAERSARNEDVQELRQQRMGGRRRFA
jgi:putative ATP-dependent endonuclease of OLD family